MARSFLEQMSDTLVLEPGGKATADKPSGDVRLRQRAGRWRLFSSSGDLCFMLREGHGAVPEELRRRVVLAGDLGGISSADLAMFISQTRLTGVLVTRAHGVDRELSFKNGKLCWAASTEPSERLGEVCVRNGLVDRGLLRRFMEVEDPDSRRLGQRLVEARLLNGHELWKAVQLQVSEIFFALLIKSAGSFLFVDAPDDSSLQSHLAIDTQGLLLEGFRRVDELRHFRRRLPSPLVVARRTGPLPRGASSEDQTVFDAVDGLRTIVEVGIASRLGEFEATKALHHLVEQGAIAVDATPLRERTPGPGEFDASLTISTYNDMLKAVYEAVRSSGMDAPYRISVDSFLQSEQRATRAFSGVSLQADGTVPADLLLAGLQKALTGLGGPAATLRQMLEAVLSFALFQSREILDEQIADALNLRARALLGK